MNLLTATILSFALAALVFAQGNQRGARPVSNTTVQTSSDIPMVSPALERYTQGALRGDLWRRPDLSPRDRSIVTLAALITRNQTTELPYYVTLALDNGVRPSEISEIITHLAFYSGWANATSAVAVVKAVFDQRGIGADQLPAASPPLLPLDQAAEEQRATRVQQDVGPVSPGLVQYTADLLFRDLWLRPDLAPRDRSLVTVSALITSGQVAQIPFHLNKAMDNGLTRAQAGEMLTQLAFYAGWPHVFSAVPVVKEVVVSRPPSGDAGASVATASAVTSLAADAHTQHTEVPMGNGSAIEVTPNESRPSARGAAPNFTGSVVIDPLFDATEHTHATGGLVTFEPSARTAWHTHPAGQTLIVTSGVGWVQEWNGDRREIKPGDVVWIPPAVKHWHGATATNRMSHIAITYMVNGKNVDWLEPVSDEEYREQAQPTPRA
jgi:4-carboxymuconolactone decarboxylase